MRGIVLGHRSSLARISGVLGKFSRHNVKLVTNLRVMVWPMRRGELLPPGVRQPLAPESLAEHVGVLRLGETEHDVIYPIAAARVIARRHR